MASFAVESRGTAVMLDPLAPPPGARDDFIAALDREPWSVDEGAP